MRLFESTHVFSHGDLAAEMLGIAKFLILPTALNFAIVRLGIVLKKKGSQPSSNGTSALLAVVMLIPEAIIYGLSMKSLVTVDVVFGLSISVLVYMAPVVLLVPLCFFYLARAAKGVRLFADPLVYVLCFSSLALEYLWISYLGGS